MTVLDDDWTNSTVNHDKHPNQHNAIADVLNDLQPRVDALEAGGGGGGVARTTASYTTASLGAGATETGTIAMAKAFRILRIQTSAPARVRIYPNAAARTADAARAVGVDPAAGVPVTLDYVTTASIGTSAPADLSPLTDGANTEATPSASIPISITATGAGAITLTLTYLSQET